MGLNNHDVIMMAMMAMVFGIPVVPIVLSVVSTVFGIFVVSVMRGILVVLMGLNFLVRSLVFVMLLMLTAMSRRIGKGGERNAKHNQGKQSYDQTLLEFHLQLPF